LLLAVGTDLCLSCHGQLAQEMADEQVHPPAAGDCLRCHEPHFAAQAPLLVQAQLELCGDCHDLDDVSFSSAHLGIDPAVMNCTNCHAPHSSTDPKMLKGEEHAPFAARSCEECHVVEKR
jgi:predicted CXXCH cytochrome family protein